MLNVLSTLCVNNVVYCMVQDSQIIGRVLNVFPCGKFEVLTIFRNVVIVCQNDIVALLDSNYLVSEYYNQKLYEFLSKDKLVCPVCKGHFIEFDIWGKTDLVFPDTCEVQSNKDSEVDNMFKVLNLSYKDVKRHNSDVIYNRFMQLQNKENKDMIEQRFDSYIIPHAKDFFNWINIKFVKVYPFLIDDHRHKIYSMLGAELL